MFFCQGPICKYKHHKMALSPKNRTRTPENTPSLLENVFPAVTERKYVFSEGKHTLAEVEVEYAFGRRKQIAWEFDST